MSRSLYLEHFGLRDTPFRITPQTGYFYAGSERGAALDALLYAVNNDSGIIVVTGEVGVGKTMLCRMLIERSNEQIVVIYVTNPALSPEGLLHLVAEELSLEPGEEAQRLRRIERQLVALYAQGKRVILMIDEAHAMPLQTLEQVRLLSNLETPTDKLLQPVLFGQPELDELLSKKRMRSLNERVTQHFVLAPLEKDQVAKYIAFRLGAVGHDGTPLFNERACRTLARASGGLVRRINILADKSLLAAFVDNAEQVTVRHVRVAIRDTHHPRVSSLLYAKKRLLNAISAIF